VAKLGNGRFPTHIPKMGSISTGRPLVEVIATDGTKSLWVAAVAPENAVAAVALVIPANHVAILLGRRLSLNRKSVGLRPGEVRRVKL
jgi:hypothetical protein